MNRAKQTHQNRVDKLKGELIDSVAASSKGILMRYLVSNSSIEWQLNIIHNAQTRLGLLAMPLSAISFLAAGKAVVVTICVLFWMIDTDKTLGWVPSRNTAAVLALCGIFKAVLKGPRPYWLTDKIKPLDPTLEASFGFPSGHTTVAILLHGIVAFHFNQPSIYAAVSVFILLVSISRVLTGAHFLHDVIGGAVIGTASLALSVYKLPSTQAVLWPENKGQLSEALVCCVLVALTFGAVVVSNVTANGTVNFKDVKEPVAGAGFLFGVGLCHILHHVLPPATTFILPPSRGLALCLLGMVLCDLASKCVPVSKKDGLHTLPGLTLMILCFAGMQVVNFWAVSFVFSV